MNASPPSVPPNGFRVCLFGKNRKEDEKEREERLERLKDLFLQKKKKRKKRYLLSYESSTVLLAVLSHLNVPLECVPQLLLPYQLSNRLCDLGVIAGTLLLSECKSQR